MKTELSLQKTVLIIIASFICILIPLGNVVFSDRGNAMGTRPAFTFLVNRYTWLSARYDSIALRCQYGEICLPNEDSLVVDFQNWYDPGLDTTQTAVSSISRTKAFPITDTSRLSVWRALWCNPLALNVPINIPDTIAWTMELYNAQTQQKIATLDSVGFYRQRMQDTTSFPVPFGAPFKDSSSYDILNYYFPNYCANVDSVYLVFKIKVFGYGNYAYCNIENNDYGNIKISDQFMGYSKYRNHGSDSNTLPISLMVFPNPVTGSSKIMIVLPEAQFLTIKLTDASGKTIGTIYSGDCAKGTSVFPFEMHMRASGTYIIRLEDASNRVLSTMKIIHIK